MNKTPPKKPRKLTLTALSKIVAGNNLNSFYYFSKKIRLGIYVNHLLGNAHEMLSAAAVFSPLRVNIYFARIWYIVLVHYFHSSWWCAFST